ncbi:GNAT family N-acetyltransferase [Cryptosporangium phraense]|uniref:GNAT family N-acetyltransferase n=1 Tax=Cryptosporangium phraense TaxID=2593070 RepID=A0A545AIK2_9ACTN|nr:GNAT family N-acetyltransferase [Cryptosporangium phraense]TQS41157.1 GNAT family N-acetyltransferase [Cryptosporangium phraense]
MTITEQVVARAPEEMAEAIAALVTASCAELDVYRWVFPESAVRAEALAESCRLAVDQVWSGAGGHADVVADEDGRVLGAAVWFAGRPPFPSEIFERYLAGVGTAAARLRQMEEFLLAGHSGGDEEYLRFLAVVPGRRGVGLGSSLLAHRLRELDRVGRAATVEAVSARGVTLCAQHGFVPVGSEFRGPGQTRARPIMVPMRRAPTR